MINRGSMLQAQRIERAALGFAIAWLLAVGSLVWTHARVSTQPPIYDAFTYYSKAKSVWSSLLDRHGADLLEIQPTFRPPGTVLMSYPFGFQKDFRGFYFRSVFFPIALVFAAVFVAAWHRTDSLRIRLMTVLTATFLSTLSLFYYFEPSYSSASVDSSWGLVDGFLSGLCALGAACGIRSARNFSFGWAIASILVCILMIFVKPTGILLAAIVGAIVAFGWLGNVHRLWNEPNHRGASLRRFGILVCVEAPLLGGAVFLAMHSAYLGPSNLMYGNAAIDVMRAELGLDTSQFLDRLRGGIGPFVPIWTIGLAIIWIAGRLRGRHVGERAAPSDDASMAVAAVVLFAGFWFWLYGSGGGTQVRYFVPFLLVAIFCALGPFLSAVNEAAPGPRWMAVLFMAVGALNTLALLAIPNPSVAWQRFSGVNVASGTRAPGIAQAQRIIAKTPTTADPVIIYSMTSGITDAVLTAAFESHMLEASAPRFTVIRPVDWQRPSSFRTEEILSSDYILTDPSEVVPPVPMSITDFFLERVAFQTWANGLTGDDGVEVESATPTSTLLHIVDRDRLRQSLGQLIQAHQWRDTFLADNQRVWWSGSQVDAAVPPLKRLMSEVHFEDKFELRTLAVEHDRDGSLELKVWFHPSATITDSDWAFFVHMVDEEGVILADRSLVLGAADKGRAPPDYPFRYLHTRFVPPRGTAKLAVGFYRASTILMAGSGERDWGGKRVLVPLDSQSSP